MKDIYRIFHGRQQRYQSEQLLVRNAVEILSEVFNQTMGGSGMGGAIKQMWPLPDDPKSGGSQMVDMNEWRKRNKAIIIEHERRLAEKKKKG